MCNWFANWRRKLKNAGKEPQRKTWGHLIKTYNSQVQGNVEHFSICSEDSIWGEAETLSTDCENLSHHDRIQDENYRNSNNSDFNSSDHSYTNRDKDNKLFNNNLDNQNQCFYVSSTTDSELQQNPFSQHKYKSHIMEKYLRDCQKPEYTISEKGEADDVTKPSMISRWLESAVNFRPSENSYLNWAVSKPHKKKNGRKSGHMQDLGNGVNTQHGREELDAAEALTRLANAHAALKL